MPKTQENGQKPCFWLFGSFKTACFWFLNDPAWVIRWHTHAHHLVLSNMQYQVELMLQTQEKGQKPGFWLLGSFKKAFFWFLNDPAWALPWLAHAHQLVLSKYAISSQSNAPNSSKWPKTWFLANGSFKRAETRKRVARKTFWKKKQIFPRHAVFAVILPEPCSFMKKFFQKCSVRGFPSKSD